MLSSVSLLKTFFWCFFFDIHCLHWLLPEMMYNKTKFCSMDWTSKCKEKNLKSCWVVNASVSGQVNMSGILRTSVYSYNAWWRTETTFLPKQKQGRLTDLTKAHFPFCFLKTSPLAMVWTFSLPQSCLRAIWLAQSVEHQTFDLRVMGSSSTSGDVAF